MVEEFDIGPLTWVKDEIDQALKNVLDSLFALESKPEEIAVLKFSQTHLYQVSGALDMVGLEGCKRFCAEIESLTSKLEKQSIAVTPEVIATLRKSIETLGNYLQDLLHGSPDQPLKLYPALESLLAIQGESADESELFFPDTSLRAPKADASIAIEESELPAYILAQRTLFQKSLLEWLRTKSDDGLQGMLTSLENVRQAQLQPAQQTLWWSASAFVDTLAQTDISQKRSVNKLCRRLDQQLKALGKGANRPTGNLMRDMLFYVAISDAATERIAKVKQLFELDELLPASKSMDATLAEVDGAELAIAQQLAEEIEALKDIWSALSEEVDQNSLLASLGTFSRKHNELVKTSIQLKNNSLQQVFSAIQPFVEFLEIEVNQLSENAVIEVAAGLNVLEDALRNYKDLSSQDNLRLSNQAQRIHNLLLAATSATPIETELPDEGLGHDVLIAVTQQIKDALKIAEQTLDTFFRNPGERDILAPVNKPLQQVIAAFDMLNMPVPASVASASMQMVDYFQQGSTASEHTQFELVAESLSMLDLFVDELPRVRPESEAALSSALQRLQQQLSQLGINAPTSAVMPNEAAGEMPAGSESASLTNDEPAPQVSPDRAYDEELLDIYLTEAEEVIANVAENLQALRVNATDPEAMIEVRRGFHTLKGSGRAVGLYSIGEVAWAVEKLLNNVIEHKLAASPELINLVEKSSAAFSGWVSELRNTGIAEVSPTPWQQEAAALEAALSTHKLKVVPEEVVIGGTHKISRALFNIFMTEAGQHMQVLTTSLAEVSEANQSAAKEPVPVMKPSDESRRAAHTLASNAGTAGFKAILNLARALEHWLDAHQGNWTPTSIKLYENVVKALSTMLEKAALLRQPKQVTALLAALKEATLAAGMAAVKADDPFDNDIMEIDFAEVNDSPVLTNEVAESPIEVPALAALDEGPTPEMAQVPSVKNAPLDEGAAQSEVSVPLETSVLSAPSVQAEAEASIIESALNAEAAAAELPIAETALTEAISIEATPDITQADEKISEIGIAQPSLETVDIASDVATANLTEFPAKPNDADNELLIMFIEEARELVPSVGSELRSWRNAPLEADHPDELQRALHTLKGSARMAGQSMLADTVHEMEDRVIRGLKTKNKDIDFDGLFQDLDRIGGFLEDAETIVSGDEKPDIARPGRSVERAQYLRMRAEILDRLINEAGEISIARSRMDREMQGFKQFSLDLTESVFRLRNQLREMEIEAESQLQSRMALLQETNETFDPLEFDRFTRLQELTRMMAESVNDVSTIQHGLLMSLDETESALQQQSRMNRELQHGLMNVRMVPFSMIAERLQRIVRQTSRELNKPVEMAIEGEAVDIDRSVLDKIGAPLEHLLRNAVAHGMETRAERKKAGKQETGSISLKVRRENDEIIITVIDDGAGINLTKVRKKAIEKGLFTKDQEIGEQALMQVIFESGFSTATSITQIAGRGVGLDSVRTDITALGGRIDVSNSDGHGAVFSIFLPVTLSVAQVVVVRVGSQTFALPSVMVEQVQKVKPAALAQGYETQNITWGDRLYPLHYLGKLVADFEHMPEPQLYSPLLLLRSATYQIALHVDEIIGNEEVVMKPIGPQLAQVPGMIGATVTGDGNVVLILNAVQLANREELSAGAVRVSSTASVKAIEADMPVVLVVDDSLTMRKVLGRLLDREGYRSVVAKDGMDALQVLQELKPDIILTDIEMPRMDGFELLRNIRADVKTADIPVVIISSRTAEKHRNLARELGVNAFLGKPVQDDELVAQISVLLGLAAPITAVSMH